MSGHDPHKERHDSQKESQDSEDRLMLSTEEECQSKTPKITWMAEKEAILGTVIQEEINQRVVTLETSWSKISNHADLKDEDPKRVMDNVGQTWKPFK